MKIIDRYLFREILRPTLLGIGLYSFVLLMNQFFSIAQLAFQKSVPLLTVLQMIVLQLPRVALLTIPMGILLGVLVGLGRLSSDSEILALRAAGLSYLRLARPVLLLGLAGMAAGAAIYHLAAPRAHHTSEQLRFRVLTGSDLNREVKPRVFFDAIPGLVLYSEEMVPDDTMWPLRGVFVHMENPGDPIERILVGRKGRIDLDTETGVLAFRVNRGELHLFDPGRAGSYQVSRFQQPFTQTIHPSAGILTLDAPKKRVEDMTTPELGALMEHRAVRRSRPQEDFLYRKAWIERAQRSAVPVASFVFALLALPLGVLNRRGGRAAGFAISVAVIIVYWVAFTIGRDLALEGRVPLPVGTWAANVLLLASAIVLLLFRQRYEAASPFEAIGSSLGRLAARLPGLRRGVGAGRPLSPRRGGRLSSLPTPPLPVPPIVDRYIAGLFLRVLLLVVFSIYALVWIVISRELFNTLAEPDVNPALLLRYVLFFSPGAAWYILPISSAVAALMAVSILEKNNEVTALRCAGISIYRVAAPVIAATLAVCALYFVVQDLVAPATNREALRVEDRLQGRTATVSPGIRWIFGERGRLYSYRDYDPAARVFQGLSVLEFTDRGRKLLRRTWVDRARWAGEGWRAGSGWRRDWTDGETFGAVDGDLLDVPEPPGFFGRREESFLRGARLHEQMSFGELLDHLRTTRRSGYDTTHLRVALYAKTAFPFTPMVMVLIGIPFAFRVGRKGSLYGLGIALGLVIVYWALFAVFNALGLEGVVPAPLAAWAPNLLFALSGTYLLLSVPS